MNSQFFKLILIINAFFLSSIAVFQYANAQEVSVDVIFTDMDRELDPFFHLVQNTTQQPRQTPPTSNQLLPVTSDSNEQQGRKCMTVCARWGEECTFIDRGSSGTTRHCRRTCQQFTEECF